MITLYGISNCDTVKKARTWLDQHNIDYQFHDFRKDGIDRGQVDNWIKAIGWETLINKRSTTWKNLDEKTKQAMSANTVVEIILEQPTLIKRPLLSSDNYCRVGFKAADYEALFA